MALGCCLAGRAVVDYRCLLLGGDSQERDTEGERYARSAHRRALAKLTSECRWTDSIGPSSRAYRVYFHAFAFTAYHGPAWTLCMGKAVFRGGDGVTFF